jgi:hypothetical protein
MRDDAVMIFESTDNAIVRAVEAALTRAKIAFEAPRVRPTLAQMGPKKPPQPFYVATADEAAAREIVETIVLRRGRIASLQPKPEPKPSDDDLRPPILPFVSF